MRETQFKIESEIPTNARTRFIFKSHLASLLPQLGTFGKDGQKVGLGFIWETQTGLGEGGLNTLSRRMQRALRVSGIISRLAEPYFLEQRIDYIRDGEPNVLFTLREGVK